jgi:hypothetical protein
LLAVYCRSRYASGGRRGATLTAVARQMASSRLFFAVGRNAGIRPQDLRGAIALGSITGKKIAVRRQRDPVRRSR